MYLGYLPDSHFWEYSRKHRTDESIVPLSSCLPKPTGRNRVAGTNQAKSLWKDLAPKLWVRCINSLHSCCSLSHMKWHMNFFCVLLLCEMLCRWDLETSVPYWCSTKWYKVVQMLRKHAMLVCSLFELELLGSRCICLFHHAAFHSLFLVSILFMFYLCLYLVFNSLTLSIFLIHLVLLCLCSILAYVDQIKHLLALPCNFYSSFINTVSLLWLG